MIFFNKNTWIANIGGANFRVCIFFVAFSDQPPVPSTIYLFFLKKVYCKDKYNYRIHLFSGNLGAMLTTHY
jgi:hypothetical protein